MSVANELLAGIPDDRVLADARPGANPVADLITAYQELSAKNGDFPQYSETWTGRDLKNAIGKLPAEDQLTLVNTFKSNIACPATPYCYQQETVAAKDERRFRHKLLLIVAIAACILLFIIVGGVVTAGVQSGALNDTSTIQAILDTAIKLITLVFTSSTGS